LRDDLQAAARYVQSQLPLPFIHEGIRVDSRVIPCNALGGDFISHSAHNEGISFYLLDVTGHGVASGLLAVSLHHSIRQILARNNPTVSPGALLTELNNLFRFSSQDGRFATMWYGHIDTKSRILRYASAGHHPALLIRNAQPIELGEGETPIGIVDDIEYSTTTVMLEPRDRIYLFSDGLFEQSSRFGGHQFGRDALHALILDESMTPDTTASNRSTILDRIITNIRADMGIVTFDDDVSIMELAL
ncbi:MAG TPA: serine/threonine-protein phosphatase, partial [Planctomycetaceae bacterium]|nr:serine/threonine-protein phosphatase [Planctomycetaceae bacterium]